MAKIIKGKNVNKPWTVRYWHEGRQRERSFTTNGQARDFVAKFDHDSRESIFIDTTDETFGSAALRMIETCRPATREKYSGVLAKHLTSQAGRKLRDVAADRDGIEALTVNHPQGKAMLAVIRKTCQKSLSAGKVTTYRLDGLKCNTVGGVRELIIATPDQIDQIARALGRDGLAVHLMAGLGLRVAEALALRGSDFVNGHVHVTRQTQNGQIVPLKCHKSFANGKDIPVAPYLSAMLAGRGEGALFAVQYRSFLARFTRAARNAGLPEGFTPHQLRHAFASALLPAGIALTDVSRWMGHADTRETSRVYAHLMPGQADRAREVLQAAWQDGR